MPECTCKVAVSALSRGLLMGMRSHRPTLTPCHLSGSCARSALCGRRTARPKALHAPGGGTGPEPLHLPRSKAPFTMLLFRLYSSLFQTANFFSSKSLCLRISQAKARDTEVLKKSGAQGAPLTRHEPSHYGVLSDIARFGGSRFPVCDIKTGRQ